MRMAPKVGARRSFVKLTFISCPLVARKFHDYRANSAACARGRQTYFEKHAYISKISESNGYLAFLSRRFAVSFRTTGIFREYTTRPSSRPTYSLLFSESPGKRRKTPRARLLRRGVIISRSATETRDQPFLSYTRRFKKHRERCFE